MNQQEANAARFDPTSPKGHYESWFLRANAPRGPEAFWIRYTIFKPASGPAIGERWAIFFSDEDIVAVRDTETIDLCSFDSSQLAARIGDAALSSERATGACTLEGNHISWDLNYRSSGAPLLLFPASLYATKLPKAKALVPQPFASFSGTLTVNGKHLEIDEWVGSQNHNWGSEHTTRYAWGQVVGFNEMPNAFLELSTAQVDIGPLSSPWLSPIVLRLGDKEHTLNGILQLVKNKGDYSATRETLHSNLEHPVWKFAASKGNFHLEGRLSAPASRFAALPYLNPPGGTKFCLNSKVASCTLTVIDGSTRTELTSEKAAFEMLVDQVPSTIAMGF